MARAGRCALPEVLSNPWMQGFIVVVSLLSVWALVGLLRPPGRGGGGPRPRSGPPDQTLEVEGRTLRVWLPTAKLPLQVEVSLTPDAERPEAVVDPAILRDLDLDEALSNATDLAVLAAMDSPTRALLLPAGRLHVGAETLTLTRPEPPGDVPEARLRACVEAAARFETYHRAEGRLETLAMEDPAPAVRARALVALSARDGGLAPAVAERALADGDPTVRGQAALAARRALDQVGQALMTLPRGPVSRRLAQGLLELADDPALGLDPGLQRSLLALVQAPGAPEEQRVQALERCLDVPGAGDLGGLVDELLRGPATRLRHEALRAAAKLGLTATVPAILVLAASDDPGVMLPAVEALRDLADPRAEKLLIELVRYDSYPVRAAAVEALGTCGGAAAVPHLRTLIERQSHPAMRERAQTALRTLQSRLSAAHARR